MGSSSPAARLRECIVAYFEVGDLESLCFDLGVDYDALPGEGKAAKVVELIEHFARAGRVVELIDRCAVLRPNVDWGGLRAAAVSDPAQFIPAAPDAPGRSWLNLPPDRALKIGIALGALIVILLLCGFSGGLLAGRFISVALTPPTPSGRAADDALREITELQSLQSGDSAQLTYDNVKATSLAMRLLVTPDSPVSDIHVQFIDQGDAVVTARLKALGNRRVVIGLGVTASGGRLILAPGSAALDVLGLEGSTFGWVSIPPGMAACFTDWLQQQLDATSASIRFEDVSVAPDNLVIALRKR